jgi:hypothetical protein
MCAQKSVVALVQLEDGVDKIASGRLEIRNRHSSFLIRLPCKETIWLVVGTQWRCRDGLINGGQHGPKQSFMELRDLMIKQFDQAVR